VPLKDYIGQNVKIIFTTLDCGKGAHFGYAYIDAFCLVPKIIKSSNEFFCELDTISLIAPDGYKNYVWDSGETTKNIKITQEGYYRVTAYSFSGCVTDFDINVSYTSVFDSLNINNNKLCLNESISADISRFNESISSWEWEIVGVANYNDAVFTHTFDTSGDFDVNVKLQTQNGCEFETSKKIKVKEVTIIIDSIRNANCHNDNDGFVEFHASDGFEPYQYFIAGQVVANNNINTLSKGSYLFSVVDSGGCMAEKQVIIFQPDSISITGSASNLICHNDTSGSIIVNVSGGTQPYQHQLNQGLLQTNNTFNELAAGIHTITITDLNNCKKEKQITIIQPDSLALDLVGVNLLCINDNTGKITTTVNGGTQPYAYQLDSGTQQSDGSFNGLAAGNYTVSITDSNNCTAQEQILITQPDSIKLSFAKNNLLCNDDSTGEIVANVTGGTQPFRYTINNNPAQGHGSFIGLTASQHTIKIKDNAGCSLDSLTFLTEPDSLTINLVINQLTCLPEPDGSILAIINGGTEPYLYSLDNVNFVSDKEFNLLPEGDHTVYVKDANDCSTQASTTLIEPIPAVFNIERINISAQDSLICGPKQAFYRLNITSGTLIDCLWQFGDGSKNYTCQKNVSHWYYNQGLFDITFQATDDEGCFQSKKLQEIISVHNKSIADFDIDPIQATDLDNYVTIIDRSIHAETQEWIVNNSPWAYTPNFELDHITPEYTFTQITKTKYHCNDTITKVLPIIPSLLVNIPNTFTPDGNNDNDTFRPIIYNGDEDTYLFEIYDRWGELVFQTTDQSIGWDGNYKGHPAKSDSYIYVVVVKNLEKTKTKVFRDFVNLLR
jgi:gliding motility-associated-like protein